MPTAVDDTYIDTFVLETRDGGKTWMKLAQVVDSKFQRRGTMMNDVLFVDERHGWIIGVTPYAQPSLLETFDGGASFSDVKNVLRGGLDPTRVLSNRGTTILIVGTDLVVASGDQGKSWQVQVSSQKPVGHYYSVMLWSGWLFPDGHWVAVGLGRGALVISTLDYGEHWSVATDQQAPHFLTDVSFYDTNHGCAVGNLPYLLCTSDGGASWTKGTVLPAPKPEPDRKTPFNPGVYMKIILLPNGMGWVLTEGAYVYQTTDSGQTWAEVDLAKGLNR
jgi:photosystem II stability/assembly factor-like uncharacterized protein